MKVRHIFLFGLLAIASVLLVSNIAASEGAEDEQQIVTHLTITTVSTAEGEESTRTIKTEFIGEPEVEKLLRRAATAKVKLDTHMENEFRRIIVIESADPAETRKVLSAFENTGLHDIFNSRAVRDTGRHIFLDVGFQAAGKTSFAVTLAPNIGQWTGVTAGNYLLRIKPELSDSPERETVLLSTEISQMEEGAFKLLATPRVMTAFDNEALIELGETETALSLTMLPRPTL